MVDEQKLLEKEVFSNRTNSPYIVEVDYNDLKIAEEKYKKREIEKVRINNRDFYISYEDTMDEDGQIHVIYVWPCAWGWSGKIDGYIHQISKGNLLYFTRIILEQCNDLYEFTDNVVYRIKNQPINEISITPLTINSIMQ